MEIIGLFLYLFFFSVLIAFAHLSKNGIAGILGAIILLLFSLSLMTDGLTVPLGQVETVDENITTTIITYGQLTGTAVWNGLNWYSLLGFLLAIIAIYLIYLFVMNTEYK